MAKAQKRVDGRQGELFGGRCETTSPEESMRKDVREGDLNEDLAVRALLSDDVRASGLSRWEIAGRMGKALGKDVNKCQIDAWTAESKEGHRFPLSYLDAWCWATGSDRLIRHLAGRLGLRLVTDVEAERAEIHAEREELRRKQGELRAREARLKDRKTTGGVR